MVTKTFSLLFWLKKSAKQNTPQPIYLRITINGKRAEYSVQRNCEPSKWNKNTGRVIGTGEAARSINAYLDTLKRKVYQAQQTLIDEKEEITPAAIKNLLLGIPPTSRKILEVFQQHNNDMQSMIGNGFAKLTHTRYQTTLGHTRSFIQWKYKTEDYDITSI